MNDDALMAELRDIASSVDPPPSLPTARQITEMVDKVAKGEMTRSGYDPMAWEFTTNEMRDQYRLLALDRFRRLAGL